MDKTHRWNLGYWFMALVLSLLLQDIWQAASQALPVPYSEFEKALSEGRIADVTVTERTARLEKYNVPYSRVVENTFLNNLMSWILPA